MRLQISFFFATICTSVIFSLSEAFVEDISSEEDDNGFSTHDSVNLGEAPHVARITLFGYVQCAGSIISPNWVLVPAKCIQPGVALILYSVVAGDINSNITEESTQRKSITQFVRTNRSSSFEGDEISPYSVLTDIALFKIYPPFEFNQFVQPIALPPSSFHLPQSTYDVYQWKYYNIPDTTLHYYTMKRIQISSVPISQCEETITEDAHICAVPAGDWGKNCAETDGAPLMYRNRRSQFLGAIYIYSRYRCTVENDPLAFIRISPLTEWIRRQIN